MTKRRRRRNWDDAEKLMICGQTRLPGISVSQVARRYDVNANQVFNWLKDPKFAASSDEADVGGFLPVEIAQAPEFGALQVEALPEPSVMDRACQCSNTPKTIEITTPDGCTISVGSDYDPDTLARLIRNISA